MGNNQRLSFRLSVSCVLVYIDLNTFTTAPGGTRATQGGQRRTVLGQCSKGQSHWQAEAEWCDRCCCTHCSQAVAKAVVCRQYDALK
jgi:hypothetical protein